MKCFTIILVVLAYWPLMLDCSLRGPYALAPTYVFPAKTYSTGDAFNMGTAVLQVQPTSRTTYHNNGGQSAGWTDSTISIWTGSQVTPDGGLSGIGYASFDLTHRQLQTVWSFVRHWWRIGPVWLFEATVSFTIYLLFSLTVGIALLPKHTVEQHVVVAHPQRKPTFVEGTTEIGGSTESDVHELVTKKQPSTNVFTLEGRLVLFSGPTTPNTPINWMVLFHPRQYYHPTGYPRAGQLGVADERLLHMLLRGVSAYHPWSWYRPSIFVSLPGGVVKQFHAGRGPTVVARIAGVTVVPKRSAHEQTVQRRVVVARPVKRPTLASCIDRRGGPPKPAVQEHVFPKRPDNPPAWIEKFTVEGRVLVYSGCPRPDGTADWVFRFDPWSGHPLTQSGDESSNRQRDIANGHLLKILMREGLVHHPSIVYIPCIVLGVPGILTASNQSLDITATHLLPSMPSTPDITTIINYPVILVDPRRASVQPTMSANLEAPVAPGLREGRRSTERVYESVPANVHEDVEGSNDPLQSIDNRTPGSEDFAASPEATLSPSPTSPTSQAIATLYPTSGPLLDEQRAAVELRSLLPLLEERASERHALLAWDNTWTRVTEQVRVEETRMEEDDQGAEVHTRRKRRGGKRNTLWKNKCRQDKDDYERHPEAGPSGLG